MKQILLLGLKIEPSDWSIYKFLPANPIQSRPRAYTDGDVAGRWQVPGLGQHGDRVCPAEAVLLKDKAVSAAAHVVLWTLLRSFMSLCGSICGAKTMGCE